MWLGECFSQRTYLRRSAELRSRSLRRTNHSAAWSLTESDRLRSSCSVIWISSSLVHVAQVVQTQLHTQLAIRAGEVAQDHPVSQPLELCDLFVCKSLVDV